MESKEKIGVEKVKRQGCCPHAAYRKWDDTTRDELISRLMKLECMGDFTGFQRVASEMNIDPEDVRDEMEYNIFQAAYGNVRCDCELLVAWYEEDIQNGDVERLKKWGYKE